ncbi:MAG: homogentisate 1,2-dioxygenase [Betaproteobacteria bacterium]|nr:homogentisate 1,2-dioxygenase [Betaproteobacteria bacterium]
MSGTAFTAPRDRNLRSWMYRILPSVRHGSYQPWQHPTALNSPAQWPVSPEQARWNPPAMAQGACDWISSLKRMALNGSAASKQGASIYLYAMNASMDERFFQSADGEWLIIPQAGDLAIHTEFGQLDIAPGLIAVIPRGIRFQVNPASGTARGYACENWGAPFRLPELGPIGSNGLANPRDFEYPVAAFVDKPGSYQLISKILDGFWLCELPAHPMNVVAWHGNYAPYRYHLKRFNTINTVSFDHPDPSIFTVLNSPTDNPGTSNLDFVIFPDRWMVAEDSFRPPWFHRNVMSEYMGLIEGAYDAKGEGFSPGCSSLHNCMSAHGPDAHAVQQASAAVLAPHKQSGTLAFMLESSLVFQPTEFALHGGLRQSDYLACWQSLQSRFHGSTLT